MRALPLEGRKPSNGVYPLVWMFSLTSMLQKITMTDSAGTLEKTLERNLLKVDHNRPLPLLDLTFGEVYGYPSTLNPAEGGTFQGLGSVLAGAVQCNDEDNSRARFGPSPPSIP